MYVIGSQHDDFDVDEKVLIELGATGRQLDLYPPDGVMRPIRTHPDLIRRILAGEQVAASTAYFGFIIYDIPDVYDGCWSFESEHSDYGPQPEKLCLDIAAALAKVIKDVRPGEALTEAQVRDLATLAQGDAVVKVVYQTPKKK